MKTLTAGMTGHLAGTAHTRCRIALLLLNDGTAIGITDHDKDLSFDLIGEGAITYEAGTGLSISDIVLQAGLDADNCEISGPIGETGNYTLERVTGGRFNRARVYIAEVNWRNLTLGAIEELAGNVSEARVEGGRFTFEIRSDCDRFNQIIGRLIVNNCDADFGDARCGVTPESIEGTVTAAADALQFTVSFPGGPYADDYFNLGKVTPLTGANAGCLPMEILDWTSAGVITCFAPFPSEPEVGDTFTIEVGCSKARLSSDPTVRTCQFYDNVENFRGFPEVPGSDQVLRATIPGQGDD